MPVLSHSAWILGICLHQLRNVACTFVVEFVLFPRSATDHGGVLWDVFQVRMQLGFIVGCLIVFFLFFHKNSPIWDE